MVFRRNGVPIEDYCGSGVQYFNLQVYTCLFSNSGWGVKVSLDYPRLFFRWICPGDWGGESKVIGGTGVARGAGKEPLAIETDEMARHFGKFGG